MNDIIISFGTLYVYIFEYSSSALAQSDINSIINNVIISL